MGVAQDSHDTSALQAFRYLQQRYLIARSTSKNVLPLGTMAGNIVVLYEQIIVPCMYCAFSFQLVRLTLPLTPVSSRDSSPYALERPGDFSGPIRTLFVADVVGEEAPVTTIYDAIGK